MKIDVYNVTFGVGKRDVKLQNIFYNKFYNYVELSSYSLAAPHGVEGGHRLTGPPWSDKKINYYI